VALARPVRMPDLRASAPGLLGTPGAGRAAHGCIAVPCADPRRRKIHTSVDCATGYLLASCVCKINLTFLVVPARLKTLVPRRPRPGCRPAIQAKAYPTSERPAILWDKL